METLVIYFSQKGKTKEAAGRIAQLSGADLAEIKTHKSYRMYRTTKNCGEDQKEIFCKMVQTI